MVLVLKCMQLFVIRTNSQSSSSTRAVSAVEIESGSNVQTIGAVRLMRWDDGQWARHRLLELNDIVCAVATCQPNSREFVLTASETPLDNEHFMGIDRIRASQRGGGADLAVELHQCHRDTAVVHSLVHNTNTNTNTNTHFSSSPSYILLGPWCREVTFSADASDSLRRFYQRALQRNLYDIYEALTHKAIPALKHVHEGPSSRVIWAAHELGIPLQVTVNEIEAGSGRGSLVNSSESHLFHPTANVMPSFSDDGIELIESGNILLYLLDRYDVQYRLYPPAQSTYVHHGGGGGASREPPNAF
jgi:hypothetical protein